MGSGPAQAMPSECSDPANLPYQPFELNLFLKNPHTAVFFSLVENDRNATNYCMKSGKSKEGCGLKWEGSGTVFCRCRSGPAHIYNSNKDQVRSFTDHRGIKIQYLSNQKNSEDEDKYEDSTNSDNELDRYCFNAVIIFVVLRSSSL